MIRVVAKGLALLSLPCFLVWFIAQELFFIIRYRLTGLKPPERKVLP